jgi:uncharacterized membrane protein
MDSKTTGIVSYLTIIGWVIALAAGEKTEYAKFHINQSLVIMLGSLIVSVIGNIRYIPFHGLISWAGGLFIFIVWLIAFIGACQGEEKEAPLIGSIKIMK